jgi:hypothetical protein
MKITFLTPNINISGGVKIILGYADRLTKKGHKVTVICPQSTFTRKRVKKVPIIYPKRVIMNLLKHKPDWIEIVANIKYVPSYEENYIPDGDVIIATAWQTASYVKDYSLRKGKKYYLVQGYEAEIFGSIEEVNKTYTYPLEKIVVANWLRVLLKEKFNENSQLILNPIDLDVFYPTGDRRNNEYGRICMLHHTSVWKGISDGVKAFEIAKQKYPKIQLVMFGSWTSKIDIDCEYYYRPFGGELRRIYNSCDIFLCPSWREGFTLPPAEAMACRCALVTTDIGGTSDYAIPGKTALVSPPKNPEKLAENLKKLLNDKGLCKKIAQDGYNYVQKFTWDKAVDKMEKLFLKGVGEE